MDLMQALILGIVQGLTEYLPVSSSAHLVIVPQIMGWHFSESEAFIFDVLVQLGTLLGVVWYFWHEIMSIAKAAISGIFSKNPFGSQEARMGWFIIIATIPAAFFGLLFKSQISAFFSSPKASAGFLLITAALLILCERFGRMQREEIGLKDAMLMGFAQALALLPGVSRSGSTMSVGILSGLTRTAAAKFSFLMSIPAMLGASLVAAKDLTQDPEVLEKMMLPVAVGFTAAAISGYLVIRWFLNYLKTQSLYWFAFYCIVVGTLGFMSFDI